MVQKDERILGNRWRFAAAEGVGFAGHAVGGDSGVAGYVLHRLPCDGGSVHRGRREKDEEQWAVHFTYLVLPGEALRSGHLKLIHIHRAPVVRGARLQDEMEYAGFIELDIAKGDKLRLEPTFRLRHCGGETLARHTCLERTRTVSGGELTAQCVAPGRFYGDKPVQAIGRIVPEADIGPPFALLRRWLGRAPTG